MFLLVLCAAPRVALAQGVIVNVYPRESVEQTVLDSTQALEATEAFIQLDVGGKRTRRQTLAERVLNRARKWRHMDDTMAARMWAARKSAILPAASVSPGSDRTAIYTELAEEVSGGWRFALGTALAVETDGTEETTPGTSQEDPVDDTETGFRRFLAGGGNLSFAAMRPFLQQNGTHSSQVLIALPRIWANVPALDATDAVDDFGGEVAAEYQYLRYARSLRADGTYTDMPELPFLTLQIRTGLVMGTNAFYRTIGHSDEKMFLYGVPTLNLQFQNGVRLGVSYFYGFGAFSDQENLRFHLTLAPKKERDPNQRRTGQTGQGTGAARP
jgi:hypothetical protein